MSYQYHLFFCLNQRTNGDDCCEAHNATHLFDFAKKRVKELGLAGAEESLAKANGYQILSLGKRVLRTETAGIVAITAVHTAWELRK